MISTKQKQLIFGGAAIAAVAIAALALYKIPAGEWSSETALAKIESAAGEAGTPEEMMEAKREVAKKLNKKMPVKVDVITTLQSVEATEEGFTYNTRLELAKAEIPDPESAIEQIRPQLAQGVCTEAFAQKIMEDMGQAFTYVYTDMKGEHVMTVKITQKDCE